MTAHKPMHKLFVRKVLGRQKCRDQDGNEVIVLKTIKEEVPEINIGSINKPNKDIIEIDFQPIEEPLKDREPDVYDMFRKFFGEQ